MLDVDQAEAQNAIVLRTIESGSQRASVFKCPQNVEGKSRFSHAKQFVLFSHLYFFFGFLFAGAIYSRDALAKELYSRLFDFIVRTVNIAMQSSGTAAQTVGLLDIYG